MSVISFGLGALLAQAAQAPETGVWERIFRPEDPLLLVRAGAWLFIGIPVILAASRWVRAMVGKRYSLQQGLVAGKLVLYPGLLLILVTTLHELQFSLTPLLGAAGIVGIAVGFASQTSVSNVISGFFLIAEKSFEVDDVIQVGTTTGRILSIDTLSVKLRTFDNRYIRIPNETLVKSEVVNITRFPIRRLDLNVGVAYKEDIPRVRKLLLEVARDNPRSLMEPEPVVFFDAYGDSSLDLRLTIWATRENFFPLKTSMLERIKARFDAEGIEIPFPHLSLYAGEATGAFPLRLAPEPESTDDPVEEGAEGPDAPGETGAEEGPGKGEAKDEAEPPPAQEDAWQEDPRRREESR
jgi:small-conductance mechanosensitive channel